MIVLHQTTSEKSREQNILTTTILSPNIVHPQAQATQIDCGASIGGGTAGDERLSLYLTKITPTHHQ